MDQGWILKIYLEAENVHGMEKGGRFMYILKYRYHLTCALSCAFSLPALVIGLGVESSHAAQSTAETTTAPRPRHIKLPGHAGTGPAQSTAQSRTQSTGHAALPSSEPEVLKVSTAHNVSRGSQQAVSRKTMDIYVPGTSPLAVLANTTPGVSFASDDPFGLDTVANTLYIRGFNQSQIGATLDGIPMGDQGFQQYNGLDINEAEIQDNIAGMQLSQGGGALSTPSTTNLGGALTYRTSDPDEVAGGRVSQTFGSNHTFRTFARVDSGKLNASGTRFYASYARTDNNLWKGYGDQLAQQVNFKLVQPFHDVGKVTAIFDWSELDQYNYMAESLNMLKTLGGNLNYLYPNYAEAYAAAQGIYSSNIQKLGNVQDESSATYNDAGQKQRNFLSALIAEFHLTPRLTEKTILYAHVSSGNYEMEEAIPSPNGSPMSQYVGHMGMRRIGGIQSFEYDIASNHIQAGFWYENNWNSFPARLYSEPLLGQGQPISSMGPYVNPYTTEFDDEYNTNTFQFFLQDTYHILHNLTVSAGFRSMLQTTHGGASYNNAAYTGASALPRGNLTAADAFLPHFSMNYNFLRHHELYFDIAENMRAYTYYPWNMPNGGAWTDANQQVFNETKNSLRPERTWDYVVGYRYNAKHLSATVDFYHVDYYNRLVSTEAGNIFQPYSTFTNAGKETMNGADVSVTFRPVKGLEIFNSFSYNDAQYEGGIEYEGQYVSLKGKHQVAYPKFMYKTNATYTYKNASTTFSATYTGRRPLSYVNDTYVPAYWLANLSATYNFGHIGFAKNLKVNFGVYNLFNTTYVGGMGIEGYPLSGDYPTLFVGAPRQYFGTVSAQF